MFAFGLLCLIFSNGPCHMHKKTLSPTLINRTDNFGVGICNLRDMASIV